MKNSTKNALLAVTLFGMATYAQANINAYSFDESTKNAPLHKEFKDGDFNPYGFQDNASDNYAYEVSSNHIHFHREFKDGDFNPYWFQEESSNTKIAQNLISK